MLAKLRFFLVCTIALLPSTAHAQLFTAAPVIPVTGSPVQMVTADFNGDGRSDIVYQDAYTGGNLHVMLGNGDGTFTTGQVIPLPDAVGTVITVGDANGDGIPDLVLGYDGWAGYDPPNSITVLLGKGDGTFSAPIYSPIISAGSPLGMSFKVGIADFDHDGHPDLVYSDAFSLYLMKGDGSGNFAMPHAIAGGGGGNVTVFDLNGDGWPDIVIMGGSSGPVLINHAGTFTAAFGYQFLAGTSALADVDGDGHPDIVCVDEVGTVQVMYGHADGSFAPAIDVATVPNHIASVVGAADLHGDHKQRVIVASPDGVSEALGAAPASPPLYAAAGNYFNQGVVADFNGDGYADIAMPGDKSIVMLFGKPDGTFSAAPSIPTNSYVGGLTAVDVNGDRIPDIVLSSNLIFPGKGDGTFGASIGGGGGNPFHLYSGDFDGNGHLGFYNYATINHNNEDGTFTIQPLNGLSSFGTFPTESAAIADFNRDGRADVALSASSGGFAASSASGNAVYIVDSAPGGTYTYTSLNFPEPVGPIGAGDFNGDGCPDIIVGAATQMEVFLGDCHGNFQPGATYPTNTGATIKGVIGGLTTSLEPSDIAVADLDGDGHLDVVYTIPGLSLAKVLYGQGDGTFATGPDIALPHSSIYVTAADLDSDGNPDLIFTGQTLATIYYGQKSRSFGTPSVLAAGYTTGKAVVTDLNLDGNPDIVIPNLDYDGGGDSNDNGFTFTVLLSRLPAHTSDVLSTSLSVSPEPSAFGQSFTATATFAPVASSANPTGPATFTLDGGSAVIASISSRGVASATFTSASVGSHVLAVTYPGDSNFAAASASATHLVNGLPTTTTLTASPNPSTYLQPVTFTATVTTPTGSTPTGAITFSDRQTPLATVPLNANGVATFTTSSLAANDFGTTGNHAIIATYAPTGAFDASTDELNQIVNGLATTTVLTVTPTSGTTATTFTLTATVASAASSSTVTPTGAVIFYSSAQNGIPGNEVGTAALVNGVATFSSTGLLGGSGYIVAIYLGDEIYGQSTSNYFALSITAAPTTLTLTSSVNPSPALTPITFTAHLDSAGQPQTGQKINLAYHPIGGDPLILTQTTDASGNAIFSFPSGFAPATYLVTASFLPTANLQFSAAGLAEVVSANPTATTLTASPSPAYQNTVVTLTAIVTAAAGAAVPAGTITFLDGATPLSTAAVAPSSATSSSATFSTVTFSVGTHSLTAIYTPGSNSFLAGQSAPFAETINPQDFTLAAEPPSITIQTQHHASMPLTLTSVGGFTAPITLTCGSPLPPFITCELPPATVLLPANTTMAFTLTLDTDGVPDFLGSARGSSLSRVAFASLFPFTLLGFSRRRSLRRLLACVFLAVLAVSLTACANTYPGHTPPGTYTIPITATGTTAGSATPTTHILDLTLTVTP